MSFYVWVYTGKIIQVLEGSMTYLANKCNAFKKLNELGDFEI